MAAKSNESVSEEKNKPGLDEQTFGKLLEAAYVLQEHNREMQQIEESLELQSEQLRRQQEAETEAIFLKTKQRPPESTRPNPDYVLTLAEIVEVQHQIQIRHLESDDAMGLVAERITRITNASGAAIGILDGKTIRYRAGFGPPALPVGSEAPLETAICAICVRTGQVLRTPDVDTEFLFDPDLCRERAIQSLVAVPVYHDGNIVGALELYFDRQNGFAEQDIHTCQLMAGLVTEAIGRAAGSALKKSMAAERSSMLAAIEKLQPSVGAAKDQGKTAQGEMDQVENPAVVLHQNASAVTASMLEGAVCWKCGGKVIDDEQFCGKCGAPRVGEGDPTSIQSRLASALQMQQANAGSFVPSNGSGGQLELMRNSTGANLDALPLAHDDVSQSPSQTASEAAAPQTPTATKGASESVEVAKAPGFLGFRRRKTDAVNKPGALVASQQQDATWSSAARAREFLEALAATRSPGAFARFWRARRGDFYLAVAVILVLVVIRWGILSNHSVGATGSGPTATGTTARRRLPADADLTMFDKLLISLGLAEAPEPPEYKGNPNTQVWIDTHTALYYCPGSDLYGKTSQGRFASQHDAQLDQFESASRRACD